MLSLTSRNRRNANDADIERKHSLSLLHVDWFEWDDKHLCGFEDDTSSKMFALMEFDAANGENTLKVFREAEVLVEGCNAYIAAVNTDRGTQFYASKQNRGEPA